MEITAGDLCELLQGELEGDPDVMIRKPAKIEEAQYDAVTFLGNDKYAQFVYSTKAAAIITAKEFTPEKPLSSTLIRVNNPYESFTKVLEMFQSAAQPSAGIDPLAFIASGVKIAEDVYIGAFAVVNKGAVVGEGAKLYPGVFLGEGVEVGANTTLYPGVKIYDFSKIGRNCIIHAGAVIGSDGFGFAPQHDKTFKKIPQLGNVIIEDNVEVGANTTIDRATMGSTLIKKGVKLDNLVQVAHNVEIGENTVIAAQTGISGSTKLENNCLIGGQVGFAGHLKIAVGTQVNAQSGIGKNTEPGSVWWGSPAIEYKNFVRSQIVFKRLPELEKKLAELERKIKELSKEMD